jgi:hypothetical protein
MGGPSQGPPSRLDRSDGEDSLGPQALQATIGTAADSTFSDPGDSWLPEMLRDKSYVHTTEVSRRLLATVLATKGR